MNQSKYIILDRDGVINQDSSAYVKTPDEWVPIERSIEAISLLTNNSYKIILISNQAGISRGIISYNEMINIFNECVPKNKRAVHLVSNIKKEMEKFNDYGLVALGMDTTIIKNTIKKLC